MNLSVVLANIELVTEQSPTLTQSPLRSLSDSIPSHPLPSSHGVAEVLSFTV